MTTPLADVGNLAAMCRDGSTFAFSDDIMSFATDGERRSFLA